MGVARAVFSALALFALQGAALADTWPSHAIRWIVPYAPGGSSDVLARAIAETISIALKQPVIIDNRSGGDTIIATETLAHAAPDGYTIGYITDPLVIHEAAGIKRSYDPLTDLVHIVSIAKVPLVFWVNNKAVTQSNLADIMSYAKKHPGWLSFASLGPGSVQELRFRQFVSLNKIDAVIVPYRNGALALADVISGQVKATFRGGTSEIGNAPDSISAIAVASPERVKTAPALRTFAEEGYPDFKFDPWFALAAPAGTPAQIVARLNAEVNRALESTKVKAVFTKMGIEPAGGPARNMKELFGPEIEVYREIIKDDGLRFEE